MKYIESAGFQCIVAYSHQTTGLMAALLKLLTRTRLIIEIVGTPQNSYITDGPNPGLGSYGEATLFRYLSASVNVFR